MSSSTGTGIPSTAMNTSAHSPSVSSVNLSSTESDYVLRLFRGLRRAESYAFYLVPERLLRITGYRELQAYVWNTFGVGREMHAIAAATEAAGEAAREAAVEAAAQPDTGIHFTDLLQGAIKITIYASTRRHLHLDWMRRLALRIIPILLFVSQIHSLLRAIKCQTSPDYPELRYGTPGKSLLLDHAGQGGFLYSLSSTLLPWETDQHSCNALGMNRVGSDIPNGTFRLLWPVFLRICLSHFVETLSSSLQGRPVVAEGGMSIFEHSLSFAEAESTISQSLGLGPFSSPKPSTGGDGGGESSRSSLHMLTKSQILDRMNVTPELLLIALISCCHCLSSNVLDVLGKQSRYRLVNTTFWGLCFMAAMTWGLVSGSPPNSDGLSVRFPTVCVVGFIPHLMILCGIIVCAGIYSIALVITAFSLPSDTPQQLTLRQRFQLAHENMQGSNQVGSVRLNPHEDFYSALLRIGYTALTAASEAVFLNEGRSVVARNMTWLEEDRLAEIEQSRRVRSVQQASGTLPADFPFENRELVAFEVQEAASEWESGYGKEKKFQRPKNKPRTSRYQTNPGGVGAFRGLVRCYQGISFFRAIFYLMFRWVTVASDKALSRVGITARPQWVKAILRSKAAQDNSGKTEPESLDFWILTDEGELELPENHEFDVEKEMRKRERLNAGDWSPSDEQRLDEKLYNWWKAGGSWGNEDHTSDYELSENDWDDTTSVVSTVTTDSEWEDESDGRRTPTQTNPFPNEYYRESTPTPESLMDVSSIARLLDPPDEATRQEARILAAHLNAGREGRVLTRRQYQAQIERQRAQVLLGPHRSRLAAGSRDGNQKPSAQEESEILEKLILDKRSATLASAANTEQTWETGASGLGSSGPPCVVCQTNSRSIIVWPCRCLCICEDCRVSLAMNNFGSCVTCRQEVGGFVRLWVP
ncbi:putative ubiquitin-protein ligase (Asi3) [Aspergillus nidulans FGSC A4]|uniref:Ubiquitin-protein ligase (Asi3), putative (AFU_orthologue AFUA_6G10590) n=1 Tax=Emericella nidulans (strain FGSC A4 / ATCC 38163 / CBS 112.46 / NRRL 194 / M139) TaxID=227321 RepID=C8VP08_EMENI|nr:hypothetical protein [Aspergillus nidulans FGSC A4]CBF86861.1 TPA: ubiquitin-protein ligase (Asi3), putative (AFU_orthologue; AFUA_6G10590) [Aspergillus nidulans FGSC A4]